MRKREISARAKRGARLLDWLEPDWFRQNRVRLITLDLEDPYDCVCGQLTESLGRDFLLSIAREGFFQYDDKLGFSVADGAEEGYPVLQETWEAEIRARRQKAKVLA
jgi:hypothetical protein